MRSLKGSRYLAGTAYLDRVTSPGLQERLPASAGGCGFGADHSQTRSPLFEVRAPGFRQQQLLQFRGLSSTPFPKLDPPEGKPNLPLVRSPPQSIHRELGP